jgi:Tol biopolymer transport system component
LRHRLAGAAAALIAAGAFAAPAGATFPGRNGLVVYDDPAPQEDHFGERWLWTMRPDGSFRRLLVRRVYEARYPRWSPDGRRVVFRGTKTEDGWTGVMTVRADGSGLRSVAQYGDKPAWTPSGRRITYVKNTRTGDDLWEARADGSRARRLARLGTVRSAEWSPDGSVIAVVGRWLTVRDGRTGRKRVVYKEPGNTYAVDGMTWSPDGRRLAFTSVSFPRCGHRYCPHYRLWTAHPDGGHLTLLDDDPNYRTAPDDPHWSPDGRTIAYCRRDYVQGHDEYDRWAMRPDGSHRRLAARTGCDGDWQALPMTR